MKVEDTNENQLSSVPDMPEQADNDEQPRKKIKIEDKNKDQPRSVPTVPTQAAKHGHQPPEKVKVEDKNKGQLPLQVKVENSENNDNQGTDLEGSHQEATIPPPPLDLANMDKHWNLAEFHESHALERVAAIHICAAGDVCDGRPPKPPKEDFFQYDPIFDSDDEDFPMREDGPEGPPPEMANHWTVLLELRHLKGAAIKLDMSPGYQATRPFREGTILVSSQPVGWLARLEIVKSLRFSVHEPTTVQQVLENVSHNARHRYLFSENGEGSRFWVHTVVEDLVTAEILGEGEEGRAEDVMGTIWAIDGGEKEKRGIRRGMFTEWTIRGEKKKGWW